MMISEFIERTGFEPTLAEYDEIEKEYYAFDGDKNKFCKHFLKTGGISKIAQSRLQQLQDTEVAMKGIIDELEINRQLVMELTNALEAELEWKPDLQNGTKMSQTAYNELEVSGKFLSEEEAVNIILNECAFQSKIKIINYVAANEINKYGKIREQEVYIRKPVYVNAENNYIRFDAGEIMYEMINGDFVYYCQPSATT